MAARFYILQVNIILKKIEEINIEFPVLIVPSKDIFKNCHPFTEFFHKKDILTTKCVRRP
jgi:hypothetical protein